MRPRVPSTDSVIDRLRNIETSGWYTNFGPQVRQLESRVEELVRARPGTVVTAASATRALEGALAVSEERVWEAPSWTFSATIGAAVAAGATLRFVDIGHDDWWIESRAPARLAVAPFGAWSDPRERLGPGELVIDGAAALGAVPDLSDLADDQAVVFSLGATKVLGAGEGGLAVFGDPQRARRFRAWTQHGFDGSRVSARAGTNAKMSEVAAAYAHAALDDWARERSEWNAARKGADRIVDELGLTRQPGVTADPTPYWIVVLPDGRSRELVATTLAEHGIATRRWWEGGCHRMPAYASIPRSDLGRTELAADASLGLPFYRGIGEAELHRIADALDRARTIAGTW